MSARRGRELPSASAQQPRYGPRDTSVAIDSADDDHRSATGSELVRTQYREDKQSARQNHLGEAAIYWDVVAKPHPSSSLICIGRIPSPVLKLHRRGRKFMELAPLM